MHWDLVAMRIPTLVLSMLGAIAVVAVLAFVDEERESRAALEDFGTEQARMAAGLALTVSGQLVALGPAASVTTVLGPLAASLGRLERPANTVVLVRPRGEAAFRSLSGAPIDAPELVTAADGGASSLRLTRERAASLGLPTRTAMAGIAKVDPGSWTVAVVTTAERERDREKRARIRLVLGVGWVAAIVIAFGGIALWEQRRELLLERRLALAALAAERDERLARASRAVTLGTLASGVAHEVATPLGVILGRAEQLLPRLAADERARRSVEAILEQTGRIDQVIRAFLAVARGEPLRSASLEPRALVEEAIAFVEHRFASAGVQLHDEVPRELPTVDGDARLLRQVIVNLLLNACDACATAGQVWVRGRAGEGTVILSVVDDGAGIGVEDAARATEPFFTTKPAGKGSGLGLAITHEIVKSHRGSLRIAPGATQGTVVEVELPAGGAHAG